MKHNPFSTRKTTPGKIPYSFRGDEFSCCERRVPVFQDFSAAFRGFNYQSQIIGGHGTGKTTFLIAFVQFLEKQGYIVNHFTLHDRQRTLSREFWVHQNVLVAQYQERASEKPLIAAIDGYEQLSLAQKIRLRLSCRKGKCGLLITTHNPAWRLPVLLRTEPTFETLQYIIGHLFQDQPDLEPPDETLCRSLFERHQGNIRDVLFDLYDQYEEIANRKVQSAK